MKWAISAVFVAVLLGHFLYVTRTVAVSQDGGAWAAYEFDQPQESRWARYTAPGEYWLGLSYGLAGAFATWCFARILRLRREALAANAAGLTLSGVLWAAVCFLTGCCGSPMLPVYLGLFGPKFLSITKPLTFCITLLSIVVGYAWMLKRAPKAIKRNVNTSLHEAARANPGEV
ncbi:MAG: hypothetical protein AMXMBFR13_14970 [Phycisphaerae bacterium]